ncbi:MAG: nucleotidyltransferase family protein [Planctomycetes bacterium]|nr:nucleotidyltransferase family protein [Planctomycetota bacterium]
MIHEAKRETASETDTELDATFGFGRRSNEPFEMDGRASDASTGGPPNERPRIVRARNLRMMRVLERIAAKFNEAGVPLMVLKGAALHLTLYEQPDDRAMADLDLMIRPDDVDQASHLLEQLGGLRGEPLVRDDFFPRFHYEIEYTLGNIYPVRIDLHVRPFRPLRYARLVPPDALWDRAEGVSIGRAKILVPSPDDMLLHLAVHAAVHGFSDQKWPADIKRWVDLHDTRINWDRFLTTVEHWHLALPARQAFHRVEGEFGRTFPPRVLQHLSKIRTSRRDRLALWQAPRDAAHPVTHVAVNAVCAPGLRFVFAYLWAVLVPDRAHMADWYQRRHWGWLPCAHLLRLLGPVSKWTPRLWAWFTKIETKKSPTHGIGVFVTRDIRVGEVVARYHGRAVERCGMYVVPHQGPSGEKQRYELTGKLRFLNHSCHPNAELSGFQLVALKPIRTGQEISIDYGHGTCGCKRNEQGQQQIPSAAEPIAEVALVEDGSLERKTRGRSTGTTRSPLARDRERTATTRRGFIHGVARKALYVTPVVMTLSAQRARAGSAADFDSGCGEGGSPCTVNADCCEPRTCDGSDCCGAAGEMCNMDMACCSNSCDMVAMACD